MKVAGYDPFMSQDKIEALGAEYYADYKELLKVADIVTVHVPLTDQTRDMISAAELATMKKDRSGHQLQPRRHRERSRPVRSFAGRHHCRCWHRRVLQRAAQAG